MARRSGFRQFDDKVLGATAIAIIAGIVALGLLSAGVAELLDKAWVGAPVYLVLGVLCARVALREWPRRGR